MNTGAETPDAMTLVDLLRLWRVDPSGHTDLLVDAVRLALQEGIGEESAEAHEALTALATEGAEASRTGLARLVDSLERAWEIDHLTGTEAQDAAVAAACRRHLAGELTPRELTYWTTRVIGLRGSASTQVFLGFEDEYTRFVGFDVTAIDADVTRAAEMFIAPEPASKPSVWARMRRRGQ